MGDGAGSRPAPVPVPCLSLRPATTISEQTPDFFCFAGESDSQPVGWPEVSGVLRLAGLAVSSHAVS